jgi:hypothetical protein
LLVALMLISVAPAGASDPAVAVYVRAYNGYSRTRLPDNSYKPESYTFAEGGRHEGSMVDQSIDGLSFRNVALTIAGPLRKRGYVPSFDPKHTDFVIVVFWGTTSGSKGRHLEGQQSVVDAMQDSRTAQYALQDAKIQGGGGSGSSASNLNAEAKAELDQALILNGLANRLRDDNNFDNAGILGYRADVIKAREVPWLSQYRDAVAELEEDRYFVVLKAYDYTWLVTKKNWKLMWEARFSIPAQGNAFNERLAAMAESASQYFGQDVRHLIRETVREGRVTVGAPTVIETLPQR